MIAIGIEPRQIAGEAKEEIGCPYPEKQKTQALLPRFLLRSRRG
jgi:hypothetical protein